VNTASRPTAQPAVTRVPATVQHMHRTHHACRSGCLSFPQGIAGGQYLRAHSVQCATWHAAVQQADRRETSMRLMMRAVGVQKAQAQEAHANIDV
jgi:hypothetical protein